MNMLSWDDEIQTSIVQVAQTAHWPHIPFNVAEATRDQRGTINKYQIYRGTQDEHVERLRRKGRQAVEAYMAVSDSSSESMELGSMMESWAVAVDFDNDLPDLCLPGRPLAPTKTIETSPGRYHALWQLRETIPAHQMSRLSKVMAARLDGDMAMARANQLIRVPGFVNQKNGFVVSLRHDLSSDQIYSADYLRQACDGDLYEAGAMAASPRINHVQLNVLRDAPETLIKHARAAVEYLKGRGSAEAYDSWWPVIANLTPLGAPGRVIAEEFSRSSAKYDPTDFESKWQRLTKAGTGAVSTLFAMAGKAGWKNPGWSDVEGAAEPARATTEREFGERIAVHADGALAATEGEPGIRGPQAVFLELVDGTYRPLSQRKKRAIVARWGAAVVKDARQQSSGDSGMSLHEKKLGNNKQLDEVCEHVAEALVPMCESRIVSGYPYLPVANGVLNLLTHQLVPARYRPIARTAADVEFDPNARADLFERFLKESLESDEMVAYMKRVLGYALLGDPVEQVLFVLIGPSNNGKSTLMSVIVDMLGKLGGRLKTETLMQKSHVTDSANPGLAKIKGTRVILAAEPGRQHKLDTSLIKQLTGEKEIYVRGLYSGGGEIPIECCIFMTANYMPFAEAQDAGLWRRIRVIPFERMLRSDEVNPQMGKELLAEAPGILNVLLAGLADYQAQGLNPPEKARVTTDSLKHEADSFEVFLRDCCSLDILQRTALKDLWAAYQLWAKANPKFPSMSKGELAQRLADRFERKIRGNLPVFVGVALTSD